MALDLASTNQNYGSAEGTVHPEHAPQPDPRITPFTQLLEAACELQLLLDTDGRIVHVGGSPEYVMGYGRTTLEQQPVLAAVPAEQRNGFANALQQVCAGIAQPMFAMQWPNPWQGRFEAGVQLTGLVEDGKVLGVMMKVFELPSRYAFEAFLRNDAPTSLANAKKSPMAMFFLDARGRCTFMNDRWAALTGQAPADALGLGFLSTVNPTDRDHFKHVAAQGHHRSEGWRLLVDLLLPNGMVRRVDAAASPLIGPDGSIIAYICAFTPYSSGLPASAQTPTGIPSGESPGGAASAPGETSPVPTASAGTDALARQAAEPRATEPRATQPQAAEPQAAEPQATEPRAAEPQATTVGPQSPEIQPAVVEGTHGSWQPPAIKEGYTDPELLLGPKKQTAPDAIELAPSEPGLDKVTGLANRLLFAQQVASTVTRMHSDALTVSVSFVDLHGLDNVRRAIGSRGTNDYLFLLAKRLEATIRSIEIAGRIDGDVVGVLSINWLFADDLPVVAHRLLTKLGEPLAGKDGRPLTIDMSLGMAVARPGEAVNDIFGRAWSALQTAKRNSETHYEIDFGV